MILVKSESVRNKSVYSFNTQYEVSTIQANPLCAKSTCSEEEAESLKRELINAESHLGSKNIVLTSSGELPFSD